MRRLVGINLLAGLFLLALFCGPLLAFDDWETYDDFNTKVVYGCKGCIDTEKWRGSIPSGGGSIETEAERKIKGKRAFMSLRSWGTEDADDGRMNGRIRMHFNDDPSSITGVCFTPRIKKYELSNCGANLNGGFVGIRYLGNYYDTDGVTDETPAGHIEVNFQMFHATWHDEEKSLKKSEFEVEANIYQCVGATCSDPGGWSSGSAGVDLNFGKFKKSNKTEFCVGYDATPGSEKFIFSAGDDVREVTNADHGLPLPQNDIHPNRVVHQIELRNRTENCQSEGMLTQYIEGDLDNIKIRRAP